MGLSVESVVPELTGLVDDGDPGEAEGTVPDTVLVVEISFVPEVVEDIVEPEERESGFDP